MKRIARAIEDTPLGAVWAAATRFEALSGVVPALREVRPVGEDRLRWIGDTAGIERAGEVVVTARRRERAIAWRSVDGPSDEGRVVFSAPNAGTTGRGEGAAPRGPAVADDGGVPSRDREAFVRREPTPDAET
jgi:uncharacterized membrane protein